MSDNPDIYTIRAVVAEETRKVIIEHLNLCPFAKFDIESRVRTMEQRWAALIGFMLGSGILGGTAGALLTKLLGP